MHLKNLTKALKQLFIQINRQDKKIKSLQKQLYIVFLTISSAIAGPNWEIHYPNGLTIYNDSDSPLRIYSHGCRQCLGHHSGFGDNWQWSCSEGTTIAPKTTTILPMSYFVQSNPGHMGTDITIGRYNGTRLFQVLIGKGDWYSWDANDLIQKIEVVNNWVGSSIEVGKFWGDFLPVRGAFDHDDKLWFIRIGHNLPR